jgi:signal transduction histidine kinase
VRGPTSKVLSFLVHQAEEIASPAHASWFATDANVLVDSNRERQAVLQYIDSRPDLAAALEQGRPVRFCDRPNTTSQAWIFPLHNGHQLVAMLMLTLPSGERWPRAALSRVTRLCESAQPLLAEDQDCGARLEDKNLQLHALAQVRSHALRNSLHDLQTPLVSLLGYARLMLREEAGSLTNTQRDYLGAMLANLERIKDEMRVARELAESQALRFTLLDLARLWPDVQHRIQPDASRAGVAIETCFSQQPFPLVADADSLPDALEALVRYVIRRTREGGTVSARFDRGEEITIRISTGSFKRLEEETDTAGAPRLDADLTAAGRIARLHGGGDPACRISGTTLTLAMRLPILSWNDQSLKHQRDPDDLSAAGRAWVHAPGLLKVAG